MRRRSLRGVLAAQACKQGHASNLQGGEGHDGLVEVLEVAGCVLGPVDLHCARVDVGLQRAVAAARRAHGLTFYGAHSSYWQVGMLL